MQHLIGGLICLHLAQRVNRTDIYRLLLFINHRYRRTLQYHNGFVVPRSQMYYIERPYEGQERQVHTQRGAVVVSSSNTNIYLILTC